MINQLIELAEELYALGQNPFEDSTENGNAMQDLAVEFGQCIQEVAENFLQYKNEIACMKDKIQYLNSRITELELKHETRH